MRMLRAVEGQPWPLPQILVKMNKGKREGVDGSRTTGAKILGLSRKALWEQGKRYGIPSAREEAEDEG